MSDETVAQPAAAQPSEASAGAAKPDSVAPTDAKSIDETAPASDAAQDKENGTTENTADSEDNAPVTAEAAAASTNEKSAEDEDVEMADKPADEPAADPKDETEIADAEQETAEAESATAGDKSKAQSRRKSTGDAKSKKLNKKASKAKILHVDAKPGDHYFAKLKGFPRWPVIVAEEDMLPLSMLNTRPVTAARPDGTYREDIADGGKRVQDRTFPVMYLYTNEFSWTTNTDLSELDPSTVAKNVNPKMRKDLQNAYFLAAEHNSLEYYKDVLREFEEQRQANLEAKEAKKAKGTKTPKKAKVAELELGDDEDVEMADVEEGVEAEPAEKKPKSKKRKADDDSNTPQRSESVKKPKIKLTNSSTPKASNGVQSPAPKESAKAVKVKAKAPKAGKEKAGSKKEKEVPVVKEPELSPEEKHVRKEVSQFHSFLLREFVLTSLQKEILFLRHRLQKGLLLRDQEPKEEEMKSMSEFLAKLETFPDLEVSIIKATKINKVLKAILKLEIIPKEEEFQFKPRSQTLLDKWNKLLATDGAASGSASATNGVNGGKSATNGVKETSTDPKAEPEHEDTTADAPEKETKDEVDAKEVVDEEKPDTSEVAANTSTGEAAAEVESTA
ncbi:hypothetical protein GGR53DRAFT_301258 [Hypoxylon sp. FL1150]|nr:hypothetical protein GGR53DRAFT_301258 [Hypoxylon sp. FL1150]